MFDLLRNSKEKPRINKNWIKESQIKNPILFENKIVMEEEEEDDLNIHLSNLKDPQDKNRKDKIYNIIKQKNPKSFEDSIFLNNALDEESLLIGSSDKKKKNYLEFENLKNLKKQIILEPEKKKEIKKKKRIQTNNDGFDFGIENIFNEETDKNELMEKMNLINENLAKENEMIADEIRNSKKKMKRQKKERENNLILENETEIQNLLEKKRNEKKIDLENVKKINFDFAFGGKKKIDLEIEKQKNPDLENKNWNKKNQKEKDGSIKLENIFENNKFSNQQFSSPVTKKSVLDEEKSFLRMSSGRKGFNLDFKNEDDFKSFLRISNFSEKAKIEEEEINKDILDLKSELIKLKNDLENLNLNQEKENTDLNLYFKEDDIKNIILKKYRIYLKIKRNTELIMKKNSIIENLNKKILNELERESKEKNQIDNSKINLPDLERIFEKFTDLKIIRIKYFPKSKNLEYTFLYKKCLNILLEKKETDNIIFNLKIFLLDSFNLFSFKEFEKEEERKKLTDIFLKFFSKKINKNVPVDFYESLYYLCYIYNKFEKVINQLIFLVKDFKIFNIIIDKEGKFILTVQLSKIPYFDLIFTLKSNYSFKWQISYKIDNLNKMISKILDKDLKKVFDKINNLINKIFSTNKTPIEKKLKNIFNEIQLIPLFEEENTENNSGKK